MSETDDPRKALALILLQAHHMAMNTDQSTTFTQLSLRDWTRRLICSLTGHADSLCLDGRRLFVHCEQCGRDSIGVRLDSQMASNGSSHANYHGTIRPPRRAESMVSSAAIAALARH